MRNDSYASFVSLSGFFSVCLSVSLSGCFDWDVLSSTEIEPDLSVTEDLSVAHDLSVSDGSAQDLSQPDLSQPDMALPTVTFTKQYAATGTKKANRALFGWDSQNVTAVGDGGFATKTVNGKDWTDISASFGTTQNLRDVWFGGTGGTGWVVGEGSTAFQWNGSAWQSKNGGLSGNLFAVFGTQTSGNRVVSAGDQNNTVFRFGPNWSADGGSNFNTSQLGIFGLGQYFWVVGAGKDNCLILSDASNNKLSCGTTGSLEKIHGFFQGSTSYVYAAGWDKAAGVVVKWTNGANTWNAVPGFPSVGKLYAVWVASDKDVWVAGEKATLVQFDGTKWTQKNAVGVGANEIIRDIWGSDANNVFLLTDQGNIYKKQ